MYVTAQHADSPFIYCIFHSRQTILSSRKEAKTYYDSHFTQNIHPRSIQYSSIMLSFPKTNTMKTAIVYVYLHTMFHQRLAIKILFRAETRYAVDETRITKKISILIAQYELAEALQCLECTICVLKF